MRNIAFYTAAVCLVLSVIVHGLTYVGINLPGYFPPLYALHLICILYMPFLQAALNSIKRGKQRKPRYNFLTWWLIPYAYAPKNIKNIGTYLPIYVIANFLIGLLYGINNGTPDRLNGEYVAVPQLVNGERAYLPLAEYQDYYGAATYGVKTFTDQPAIFTERESLWLPVIESKFRWVSAVGIRTLTGHWLLIFFIAFAYYGYPDPRLKRTNAKSPQLLEKTD